MHETSWVAGGGRGIGAKVAEKSWENGDFVFVSIRDENRCDEELVRISSECERMILLEGDLEEESVVQEHLGRILQTGRLSKIYNATHRPQPSKSYSELEWSDFHEQVDGTVKPLWNIVKAVEKSQLSGLAILAFSSVTVASPHSALIPRTSSKSLLEGLVVNIAPELASSDIRINAISIGWTSTPQLHAFLSSGGNIPLGQIPIGRLALPSEIAEIALFLCDKTSSYITGSIFPASGGLPTGRL